MTLPFEFQYRDQEYVVDLAYDVRFDEERMAFFIACYCYDLEIVDPEIRLEFFTAGVSGDQWIVSDWNPEVELLLLRDWLEKQHGIESSVVEWGMSSGDPHYGYRLRIRDLSKVPSAWLERLASLR